MRSEAESKSSPTDLPDQTPKNKYDQQTLSRAHLAQPCFYWWLLPFSGYVMFLPGSEEGGETFEEEKKNKNMRPSQAQGLPQFRLPGLHQLAFTHVLVFLFHANSDWLL